MTLDKGKRLPKRDEIDEQYKWDLEAIYPDDQTWENDFNKVKQLADELKGYNGKIKNSATELFNCLKLSDELSIILGKAYVYARMKKDEDNTNSKYQALADRVNSLSIYVNSVSSFIVPEILSIPSEELDRFLQEEDGLKLYKHYLDEIVRMKPHVLPAEQEQLLAQTGEIAQAPDQIFGMLNNADIKFPVIKDENNQEVELTKGRYIQFMESSDRRVRKDAFTALYNTYSSLKNTFAATLNSNVKKNIFYAKVRNYPSALEASLYSDNVSVQVYDQLIDTIHKNMELMHRYVSIRKKMLGLDELHMYDLYTPIVKDTKIKVTYEEAKQRVIEGLKPLGDEYLSELKKGIDSRWIDVYENEGKTSGAYSWGSYGTHPYILMNYQDNVNDMFTLAHELGHSMHSYFSQKNQPYIYSHYKIFVAEVASTLNEALLMDYLLKTTTDKNEKLYYLNYYLEQFRTTVYRQTMFAEFEKMIHEKVEAGEALTAELLNQIYHQLNVTYYGPEIVVDDLIKVEWARIPHFYMNFYVYKYATGFSAAISLAKQILEEGESAVKRYLEFLKSGGVDYPINLLKRAGVDMNTKEPIQSSLDVFKDIMDQIEELID
ncbi:oligoendopeptidase F [Vulcanibacillus modesticaldus]|uniref:Oligopeptidase F n=1 Tax=Vulcanibacillus modesticaldus TaxID=337097 RepID=A0A1D2YU13_9BACI|nr:oligoendopeptidase F [Vulcanibacillus modesticaldus]OEF99194.1 oligoendopeptidase F [Vulcanibacillus modesticaldus]